jgi:uncharacterized protein (TIGR02646 family)
MIRIDKPEEEPEVLRTRGKEKRRVMASLYTRFSEDYNQGKKSFHKQLDPGIYAHRSVKQALIEAQHGKCAFCESKVTHVASGDVEHFRPKKGYRQRKGDPLGRPGYYWLAYEWSNLFFACEICNRRQKRNLFPLSDPAERAISHHDDYRRERPLFVHPAQENPEQYISFQKHEAVALHLRGEMTIDALGLNRSELLEVRLDQYEDLKWLHTIIQLKRLLPLEMVKDAQADLDKAVSSRAQYSAMARAAVASGFRV